MEEKKKGKGIAFEIILSFILFAAVCIFIKASSIDIVYSDYMRIVNSYLPEGFSIRKFLVPDVFTRLPLYYLVRWINVKFFSYSVDFERILGLTGLLIIGILTGSYTGRQKMGVLFIPSAIIIFCLDKYEMLLNGTGSMHILFYALSFYGFLTMEKLYSGEGGVRERRLLRLIPYIMLLVAGPYICQYVFTVTFFLFAGLILNIKNTEARHDLFRTDSMISLGDVFFDIIHQLTALFVFLLSLHMSADGDRFSDLGATGEGIFQVFKKDPAFFIKFLLNGFASDILEAGAISEIQGIQNGKKMVYLLGAAILTFYLLLFIIYIRNVKETIFPALLLFSGLTSHLLVVLSRYIFLDESYSLQSRYMLQYMPGILGAILIMGILLKKKKNIILMPVILIFTLGHLYSDIREINSCTYRKIYFENMREAAFKRDMLSDEELNDIFEYHHGDGTRRALDILEENGLNIFRNQ